MNNPVIILGLTANGLAQVRSLASKKIKVVGIYSSNDELGRFSLYCKSFKFPDVRKHEKLFKKNLLTLAKDLKAKPVLFAENDIYIDFLSRNREDLEQHFLFILPDREILEKVMRKDCIKQLAEMAGLIYPKTFVPTDLASINKIADEIEHPCIIKPCNSFSIKFPSKEVVIKSKQELIIFYMQNSHLLNKKTIIQEIIKGGDENVFECVTYLDNNSTPLAFFTFQKIRQYPTSFGVTSFGVSKTIPAIIKKSIFFLQRIKFKGFADLEYKWDKEREDFVLLELNPRLTLPTSLAISSGINLPYIAYINLVSNGNIKMNNLFQKDGIYWLFFRYDLASFIWKRRNKEISIISWFRTLSKARSFAWFDKKDVLPFLKETERLIKISLLKLL